MCCFSPYTNYTSAYNPSDVNICPEMWNVDTSYLFPSRGQAWAGRIEQTAWALEPVRRMRKAVAVLTFCGSLAPPLN